MDSVDRVPRRGEREVTGVLALRDVGRIFCTSKGGSDIRRGLMSFGEVAGVLSEHELEGV